ncbi:NADP-specific glutamate dehydrogenase [bacterium]|nr:NADP-specific glutamate dehydrogenase [bacterium]
MSTTTSETRFTTHINDFMDMVKHRSPGEPEFHQAVQEVAESIIPFVESNPKYKAAKIFERMTVPDRVIMFRVVWEDDQGIPHVNLGYRVQFNNAIGPYKGGFRFHPSVTLGTLKFLGFEQVLKNSLTTLPLGGAKGGSDFDPKGRSDNEVMRFCQAFMTEMYRHIGADVDVPAGDIGVGAREIGYLFGQYKRIANEFTGVLTGKGVQYGGSLIRPEATGYGSVYFAKEMLATQNDSIQGKTCLVSGAGNVAQYTIEKIIELGGRPVTFSDSTGFIHDADGITREKLSVISDIKNVKRVGIADYIKSFPNASFYPGERPWRIPGDLAFPSATQNEISGDDARHLVMNGCRLVSEGANMPTTLEGIEVFRQAKILFAPGKAANAGGVAISGLEMTQNSMRLSWTRDEVDAKLQEIMARIHTQCVEYGQEDGFIDYVKGANIAGFIKVADALLAYGTL